MRTPVERRVTGTPVTAKVLMSNSILPALGKGVGFKPRGKTRKIKSDFSRSVGLTVSMKMNFIFKMPDAILTLHAAEAHRRPALHLSRDGARGPGHASPAPQAGRPQADGAAGYDSAFISRNPRSPFHRRTTSPGAKKRRWHRLHHRLSHSEAALRMRIGQRSR